jgi:hypothetical protein
MVRRFSARVLYANTFLAPHQQGSQVRRNIELGEQG